MSASRIMVSNNLSEKKSLVLCFYQIIDYALKRTEYESTELNLFRDIKYQSGRMIYDEPKGWA